MRSYNSCVRMRNGFFMMLSVCLPILGLHSCRTASEAGQASQTVYVHDTVTVERWHTIQTKDSVLVSDSMSVEYKTGAADSAAGVRVDTLRERHWHKEKELRREDAADTKASTAYRTVQKTVTRTVAVKEAKPLTAWQRFLIGMGTTFIFVILMVLSVFFIKKGKG